MFNDGKLNNSHRFTKLAGFKLGPDSRLTVGRSDFSLQEN